MSNPTREEVEAWLIAFEEMSFLLDPPFVHLYLYYTILYYYYNTLKTNE